jgi:hypothetical protein
MSWYCAQMLPTALLQPKDILNTAPAPTAPSHTLAHSEAGTHLEVAPLRRVVPRPDGAHTLGAGEESAREHKGAVAVGADLGNPTLPEVIGFRV